MKRLVVCCDGTWNVADPAGGSPTNIVKIALQVAEAGPDRTEQRVFYDAGVGTGRLERLRGGVFGRGLSANVLDAYRFVVEHLDDGDELFLFGFSRGAFTARSLAGLIRNSGVLRREHVARAEEAYRLYRSRRPDTAPTGRTAELFRRAYARRTAAPEGAVRFLGVFDTVGALGLPVTGRAGARLNHPWQFHDTGLSPAVGAAYQALAVDEWRRLYRPLLWTGAAAGQEVEQVWFRGVHSDIGGGYRDPDLADVALLWMVEHATKHGLVFSDGAFTPVVGGVGDGGVGDGARARGDVVDADTSGVIHPHRWWWRLGGRTPRALVGAPGESVAPAARRRADPPLPSGFAPAQPV